MMNIEKNKVVSIDYTLKNEAGTIIDSSAGKEPLQYLHGSGQIIVGLEQVLAGKTIGDSFTTVVMPEDAYGLKQDDYIQNVSIDQFEDKSQVQVGAQFQIKAPQQALATIVAVNDTTVRLDLNHPLAGETLQFDVKVMDIRDATSAELCQVSDKESCSDDPTCCS